MEAKEKQLQIEVSSEVSGGVYSNMAVIQHSSSEFVLDFVSIMPGSPKAQVRSRVVLAPEHAKRLLFALQDNVAKYERQFGKIQLENKVATPSPIFGKGEA